MATIENFFRECSEHAIPILRTDFQAYLNDESRFRGEALGVARPGSDALVMSLVSIANRWGMPLTIVGGKTSLTGASVPVGGIAVDLRALDRMDPDDPASVGSGVLLGAYKDFLQQRGLSLPPDPTSMAACTLGGIVACNVSGALSYLYGPTRGYVKGLQVVLPTGALLDLLRGDVISQGGFFRVPRSKLVPPPDADLPIPAPRLKGPDWKTCKSAAGLFSEDPMDLVDLFIGSEGILGIVLRVRTIVLPRRRPFFAMMLYPRTLEDALDLVRTLHGWKLRLEGPQQTVGLSGMASPPRSASDGIPALEDCPAAMEAMKENPPVGNRRTSIVTDLSAHPRGTFPSCMEWVGSSCAEFVSRSIADTLRDSYGCLYVEQDYGENEDPMDKAGLWGRLLERSAGSRSPMKIDVALDQAHIRRMQTERLRIPQLLNESIQPGLVKIATDFAVPMERLEWVTRLYERHLAGFRHYVFGHIGNAHLHVNILPRDPQEVSRARILSESLARDICRVGGSVSAEHGIGKLKHRYLEIMVGTEGIDEIRRVKTALDPRGILNMGNMVPDLRAEESG